MKLRKGKPNSNVTVSGDPQGELLKLRMREALLLVEPCSLSNVVLDILMQEIAD